MLATSVTRTRILSNPLVAQQIVGSNLGSNLGSMNNSNNLGSNGPNLGSLLVILVPILVLAPTLVVLIMVAPFYETNYNYRMPNITATG